MNETKLLIECRCDGNPSGGSCAYPDCQLPPPSTQELLKHVDKPLPMVDGQSWRKGPVGDVSDADLFRRARTALACSPHVSSLVWEKLVADLCDALASESVDE